MHRLATVHARDNQPTNDQRRHDTAYLNKRLFYQSKVRRLKIQDGGGRHLGFIFRLYEFGYSGVLTVWYLCSVPNLVQIYVIVTEIDALMLLTFI